MMDKKPMEKRGRVIIPAGVHPWPHEVRVAQILAEAGYVVEFLVAGTVRTADILLDGVEFEMKSPRSNKTNSLEWLIKEALKQSSNIIFDSSRIKNMRDDNLRRFLVGQKRTKKKIGRMILITKQGKIVDIGSLV